MVLKANKKRQEILVPLRLVGLIPENDFCFFTRKRSGTNRFRKI